jgi:hypothetical protein
MYSQRAHYLIQYNSTVRPKSGDKEPRIESMRGWDGQNDFSAYGGSQHPPKKWKVNNWPVASARQKARVCGERREQWPGGGWRRDFRWLTLSLRSLGVCCGAAHILVTRATDQSDPKNHPADASYLPGHKHTHHFSLTGAQIAQVGGSCLYASLITPHDKLLFQPISKHVNELHAFDESRT